MRTQHRAPWIELDLDDEMVPPMMMCPGWTEDRESLATAIREAGWFPRTGQAREAAEAAELTWGWVGFDENLVLWPCHLNGWCEEIGTFVTEISQVTLATVTAPD